VSLATRKPAMAGLALAAAALALAGPARAETVSVEEGGVKAVFSYLEQASGDLPYADLRLQISRGGTVYYEAPVSSPRCPDGCVPDGIGGAPKGNGPLALADLEHNGQSSVVLGISTGGAHCCSVVQVFSWDPATMTYARAEHDFGDPGARLAELNFEPVLESADDRFAYVFAPYAWSALPLQVWRFGAGRFTNVTSAYPKAIGADAARLLEAFPAARREGEGNGIVAAWAADEYELGHGRLVRRVLAREAAAGRLRSREHYAPSGRAFVKALMHFLKRTGYR
jgi:hypothetical protein